MSDTEEGTQVWTKVGIMTPYGKKAEYEWRVAEPNKPERPWGVTEEIAKRSGIWTGTN